MIKIQCEETIEVDGAKYGIAEFVRGLALTDSRFSAGAKGVLAAARVHKAPTEIESADFEILRAATEEPTPGYPVKPAMLLAPFIRAILAAKEE